MAKVTIIKKDGRCFDTSPMQPEEARDLYNSLKSKTEDIVVLSFI